MRSTNRKRALLVSTSVILLCLTIIVGTTFALFTDTRVVKHHLKAGDMKLSLTRTKLVKTVLHEDGYLYTPAADTTVINFTNANDTNVFGMTKDSTSGKYTDKIVPGSSYSATMKIENLEANSDVAFGYWIEIVCSDATKQSELAKQVKLMATGQNGSTSIADGWHIGTAENPYGKLLVGDSSAEFTVTITFENAPVVYDANGYPSSENDPAQLGEIEFDLIICAVQLTDKPTNQ